MTDKPKRKMRPKNTYTRATFADKRHDAIEEIRGELDGREDVLQTYTPADIARELFDFAVAEHRAGRGPWAVRR